MDHESIRAVLEDITSPLTPVGIVLMIQECAKSSEEKYIHPVYRKDRWPDISDEDFVRISPALVLATYFLQCPQTTQYLYTMVTSARVPLSPTSPSSPPLPPPPAPQPAGQPPSPRPPPTSYSQISRARDPTTNAPIPLTQRQKDHVSNTLLCISTYLTLHHTSEPDTMHCAAFTENQDPPPHSPYFEQRPWADAAMIIMSLEHLRKIDFFDGEPWCLHDTLVRWFRMAITLTHEMAHVVWYYIFGADARAPVFEGQGFAEVGYAVEGVLLGGSFNFVVLQDPVAAAGMGVMGLVETGERERFLWETPHFGDERVVDLGGGRKRRRVQRRLWFVREQWLFDLFSHQAWGMTPWPEVEGFLYPQVMFFRDRADDESD